MTSSPTGTGAFIYDGASGQWLPGGPLPLGQNPEQGILFDQSTSRVYVANAGSNTVTVIQDCR